MYQGERLKKILVVEDEIIIARDIQEKLLDLEYEVPEIAKSGEQAIVLAEKLHPDLVLMDILLEGNINGIEAANWIKQKFDIPVIYLTSLGNKDILVKAKNTDPFGYLLKPFQDQELLATIEMAFNRYRIEKELEQSRNYFSTTLSCIGDAVITTDKSGIITFINPVAEKLTGWSYEEAVGRAIEDIFNIVNETTGAPAINPVNNVLEKGLIAGLANHTILINKEGKEIPIDDSGAPIKNWEGMIIGVVLVFRDVTTQRQYIKETERLKKMYGDILDYILDGIWAANNEDIIYYANNSMTRISGITSEELIGKNILEDFSDTLLKNIRSYYQKVKQSKSVFNFGQVPVITADGRQSLQSGWLVPILFEEQFHGIICTINQVCWQD